MYSEESRNLIKNKITKRMHNTKGISGLAYLEYLIHIGIDESENTESKADFLFVIFNAIK